MSRTPSPGSSPVPHSVAGTPPLICKHSCNRRDRDTKIEVIKRRVAQRRAFLDVTAAAARRARAEAAARELGPATASATAADAAATAVAEAAARARTAAAATAAAAAAATAATAAARALKKRRDKLWKGWWDEAFFRGKRTEAEKKEAWRRRGAGTAGVPPHGTLAGFWHDPPHPWVGVE